MARYTLRLKNNKQSMVCRVEFDAAAHAEDFYRRYAEAVKAEIAMKQPGAQQREADAYGAAILRLYALVLGENAAQSVDAFFGDNVLAMITQVNAFIRDRVQPDVDRASAAHRRALQKSFLRDQRRAHRAAE